MNKATACILALCASAGPAMADLAPETLTIDETIEPGPNVLVMDFGMTGSSPVYVLGAADLALKGNIGAGTYGQMVLSPDGKTLYTVSDYLERYVYGEVHAVVHEWDVQTLSARREFEISNRFAQAESQPGLLTLSADGGFLLVQNATPATSVTIVDLAKGAGIAEVPTPGCWTAIPAATGPRFTTICGDGTLTSFGYGADGSFTPPAKSAKIFDADSDPLFANPVRVGGKLVYASFGGSLVVVDDSGAVPVLDRTVPFAVEDWAPGGSEVLAYHPGSDTIFVMMHKGREDGLHKAPAEEIWALDAATFAVKGRSPASGETGIHVSGGASPDLFGVTHHGALVKYTVTPGATVTLTKAAEREGVAIFPTLISSDY